MLPGLMLCAWEAQAGGPRLVGGPNYGIEGQPFIWNPAAMPVQYRADGGSLSRRSDGTVVINNAAGANRLASMFQVWQDVPTASISFSNAGPIQSTGVFSDGDVDTYDEFNAVYQACYDGAQSPIIFDADGSLVDQLGYDQSVIGFSGQCKADPNTGYIVAAIALMNGRYQDGVEDEYSNHEITTAEFNQAFAHEFGHFIGLDHSQINMAVQYQPAGACSADIVAGLPLMFPVLWCQARTTAGLPPLAPDDTAWVSYLYPETTNSPPTRKPFATTYGTIRGTIFFSDGITPVQGVNVIARDVTSLNRIAVSVVSGYAFTSNPGQSVTGTNDGGSELGSRQLSAVGSYNIPVPPGTYRLEVESVYEYFTGGSSVGPLDPPLPNPGSDEYWNTNESATDSPTDVSSITVTAGGIVSEINIILNGTPPRFDSFESSDLRPREPLPAWLREDDVVSEVMAG